MHNFIPMRAGENLIWHSNVEHSPFSHKIILALLLSYNLTLILFTLQVFATGLAASWSTQSIGRSSVLPVENIWVQFWHLMVKQDSPFLEIVVVWWWFSIAQKDYFCWTANGCLRCFVFVGIACQPIKYSQIGACAVCVCFSRFPSWCNTVKLVQKELCSQKVRHEANNTLLQCPISSKQPQTMQVYNIYCQICAFCAPKKSTM